MDEIINQETPIIETPPIQEQQTTKKKPSIWILLSILFFLTTITLSYLLLTQKTKEDKLAVKEDVKEKTTGIIKTEETKPAEQTDTAIPEYPNIYDEIIKEVRSLCPDLSISSPMLSFNNTEGPFWWDESNQKLGSLSGYNFSANLYTTYKENKKAADECFDKIDDYLSKNMEESVSNSPKFTNFGQEFYDYKGYEKENIKCYLNGENLICGQFIETLPLIQNIYMNGVKDLYIYIGRIEGRHILISSRNFFAGGQQILEKNDQGNYNSIGVSQDSWPCDMVFEHNIAPILVDNFCTTKDMDAEYYKNPSTSEYTLIGYRYSSENKEWEKVRLKRENGEWEKFE
jgi:hypothetical protein